MGWMGQITAISATKRDPQRATVRAGGRVVATLSVNRISELGLQVGQTWDEALARQVADSAVFDKAMRAAMQRLNRRALSCRQLDRKLRDLGFEDAVRARVRDRLLELGVLDDEALGRAVMRQLQSRRAAGPRLLRDKLMQRGLDQQLVDRLVDESPGAADQVSQAVALVQQKLTSMARLDVQVRRRRLWGMLARRGFESETIESALQQIADLQEQASY